MNIYKNYLILSSLNYLKSLKGMLHPVHINFHISQFNSHTSHDK